jgi:hypothetical protein
MERVEYPFWRTRCPDLTEIVIGWDLVCMLSEKFPEKGPLLPTQNI